MNPSRLFILRPVATSLLMLAILLSGIVAYRLLPLSALPEVDYPTIQVVTLYPGASPEVMTSSITAPLERQFGQMPGLNQMSSTSSGGASVITLQFSLKLTLDIAEQEVQAAINASGNLLPTDLPDAADLQQGESGRCADPGAGDHVEIAAAAEGAGPDRYPAGAEDRPASGRGPGQHQRRPAAGGAHPRQSDSLGRVRLESRRRAHRDRQCQRESGQGQLRRPVPRLHHRRQRSAQVGRGVQAADHRLQGRRPDPPERYGRGGGRRRERAARSVGQRHRRSDPQHPAPAGRQRDRGGGSREETAASAAGHPARLGRREPAHRPHHHHPRLGEGRAVRAVPGRRPGGDGDLPVPAQPVCDLHPERRRAAVSGRHVRRDVSGRLQHQQSDFDGADDRDRLRGGRRHRDDREHRALHRGRRNAAAGRAQGRRADRLHHHLAHGVADRRAHPAAVHGRRGRDGCFASSQSRWRWRS